MRRAGPVAFAAALALLGCDGGAVAARVSECDAERPCAAPLVCHVARERCSAPAADFPALRVELRRTLYGSRHLVALDLLPSELGDPEVRLVIPPMVQLSGTLIDAGSGEPIPGSVALRLELRDLGLDLPHPRLDLSSRGGTRAQGGQYRFSVPAGSAASVLAVPGDEARVPIRATRTFTQSGIFNVPIPALAGIGALAPLQIRLIRADSAPLVAVRIWLRDASGRQVSGSTRSDEAGRAQIFVLPDAALPLTLHVEDLPSAPGAQARIEIEEGALDPAAGGVIDNLVVPVLPLEGTGRLRVSARCPVVPRGPNLGIGGVQITAVRLGPGLDQVATGVTGGDGAAALVLQPGAFLVATLPPEDIALGLSLRSVQVSTGGEVRLEMPCRPRAAIGGTIFDLDGFPVPLVGILATAPQDLPAALRPEGLARVPRAARTSSDPTGQFRLLGDTGSATAPVVHHLLVTPPDPTLAPPFVALVALQVDAVGAPLDQEIALTLPRPLLKTFRVTDAAGTPLPGVDVSARWPAPEAPGGSLQAQARTDVEGRVVLALPGRAP